MDSPFKIRSQYYEHYYENKLPSYQQLLSHLSANSHNLYDPK